MAYRISQTIVAIGLIAPAAALGTAPGHAGDVHVAPVIAYVDANVRPWITDPVIIDTLRAKNAVSRNFSQSDIDLLDAEWRVQFASRRQPLIESILTSPLSSFLKSKQAAAQGAITEIFVMDARGLSVGESAPTTDYWQGDEAKWQRTFPEGAGALFVDRPERDQSTQTVQSQASMTISDPATGKPIGALTVGINLDAL